MTAQPVSRYAIIWAKLKLDKEVQLAAPPQFHARLKKAIIKRKDLDLRYKFILGESIPPKKAKLIFFQDGAKLIVKLEINVRGDYL